MRKFITIDKLTFSVGQSGIILRTTNGGTNWITQYSGTTSGLRGVSFTDANNGTTVGENGTILRTTNGGITFIKNEQTNELPDEYSLSQNYPNPFNPVTTIKFSLPKASNVKIVIYDLLGREVDVLLNAPFNAGNHSVGFDGNNLPSGVYFYRIEAGDFNETRKMILMK